jgi:hypothetical protein
VPAIYCDVPIGKDVSGNFSLSYKGIAVRSGCEHRFSAFRVENGEVRIYDVTGLTLPGCDGFVYRVPVQSDHVRRGDLLLISECPFQVIFVEEIEKSGRVKGITATGDEVKYLPPVRLGDCVRYIRIVSVLDACGAKASEMSEDDIALVAALLCCKPCGGGYEYTPAVLTGNLLPEFKAGKLSLLLALQQGQCLESFILTRALQGRIDAPCKEPRIM